MKFSPCRNPWLEGPGVHQGHGPGPGPGSHSSGSTTYDGYMPVLDQYVPDPPQPWHQHQAVTPTTPVYEVPEGGGQEPHNVCTLPHRNTHHRCAPSSDRPLTPGGLSQLSGNAASSVSGCAECDALDTWCYYCIQGVLGIAALTGLSLLIAAVVLRGRTNLSAMPYIGAMLALVAGALLLVQLFARNEKKRKKKRLQHLRDQRAVGTASTGAGGTLRRPMGDAADLIPLQDLHKIPTGPGCLAVPPSNLPLQPTGHLPHQFQPLLTRPAVVGQNQPLRPQEVMLSPNGTPWWRRQASHPGPGRVVYPS
ncbi:hypothetical protein ONE63_007591 [Megalurothrips usitatus]|uniref:Uncharacterized protein n=1 Tax=Megalurothrips usitatus TaxID=439358 RepID=A0AAV7XN75_9NEOP|nr:hypothetical protein ONE63_007591 [Megalurothrips usitatus]